LALLSPVSPRQPRQSFLVLFCKKERLAFGHRTRRTSNDAADRLDRPEFAQYDAEADRLSWAAMLDLLEQTLR
jgi:hypothetical protein